MKKLFVLFLTAMMLVSFIPVAFAEEDVGEATPELISAGDTTETSEDETGEVEEATEEAVEEVEEAAIDEETEEETELIAESGLGAKVRILQLKQAVTKSYITGTEVVNVLKEKEGDVSELEAVLAEIEILKEEVDMLDSESETAVEDFVNVKRDLRMLNNEFKKIVGSNLSADDKQAIKDALKDNEELANLNQEIRDAIRELNANRVGKALERMGLEDPELVDKIESGNVTREEVKTALGNAFGQLSDEEKEEAKQRFRETIENRKELRKNVVEKIKAEHIGVGAARGLAMINKLPVNVTAAAKKKIMERVAKLNRVENKLAVEIKDKKENIVEIKENIKDGRTKIRQEYQEKRDARITGSAGGDEK
ncbi:hypothetical protein ISS05_04265 [Candidatus Woesearchaeota archaeon]|nr:hypothetical protein [Candidatus Woesearchaeota archaeon]